MGQDKKKIQMTITNCTSLMCNSLGCDYCKKCSHACFKGQGSVNGKEWRWEFNPMFGPLFLRKNDVPLKNQPLKNHPVWKVFDEWHNNVFKKL